VYVMLSPLTEEREAERLCGMLHEVLGGRDATKNA